MYIRHGIIADAVFDAPHGKKNIMGTFTSVFSSVFPFAQRLSLYIRIEGDASSKNKQVNIEVGIVDADHKDIAPSVSGPIVLGGGESSSPGADLVLNYEGLPIPKSGTYEFLVKADGRFLGSIPFSVVDAPPPQGTS